MGGACAEPERSRDSLARPPLLATAYGADFLARELRARLSGQLILVRARHRTPHQLLHLERLRAPLQKDESCRSLYASASGRRDRLEGARARYAAAGPHRAFAPIDEGDPLTPPDICRHGVDAQLPARQVLAEAAKQKLEQPLASDAEAARGRVTRSSTSVVHSICQAIRASLR